MREVLRYGHEGVLRITIARNHGCEVYAKNVHPRLGGHLATSLRTPILVIVASAAFIRDSRNVRLLLLSRLELPQFTKANSERPEKFALNLYEDVG